jgi:hypothetical protein
LKIFTIIIFAVVAFAFLNKIGETVGDALSFWRTQSDTTAFMATTSTQPCSGTYNGASFKDNDKGIDYTSKAIRVLITPNLKEIILQPR